MMNGLAPGVSNFATFSGASVKTAPPAPASSSYISTSEPAASPDAFSGAAPALLGQPAYIGSPGPALAQSEASAPASPTIAPTSEPPTSTQQGNSLSQSVGQAWNSMGAAVSSLNPARQLSNIQSNLQMPQLSNPLQNVSFSPMSAISQGPKQIAQNLAGGAKQAIQDLKQNAPALLGFGGAMVGASAICPFAGGAMAATGAAGMLSNHKTS